MGTDHIGRIVAMSALSMLILASCASPYVNYVPAEYDYKRSTATEIRVYMNQDLPDRAYTVVGQGNAPLGAGRHACTGSTQLADFTVEQGIEALRKEALRRGCDAIVGVQYYTQEREMPAIGGYGGNLYGYGGGFTGPSKVTTRFVIAQFAVWK